MGIDKLSLDPDDHMKWIYDQSRPDYHDPRVQSLRDARDRALRSAPEWMIKIAESNDNFKRTAAQQSPNKKRECQELAPDTAVSAAPYVCAHGHLARVCEICKRDKRIVELERERDELRLMFRQIGREIIRCAGGGTFENYPPDAVVDIVLRVFEDIRALEQGK